LVGQGHSTKLGETARGLGRDIGGAAGLGTMPPAGALSLMAKDQHGITKDKKAQEQPTDKEAAQKAGVKEQKDAAQSTPESPGEPAGGE
jgi:hypothetical protein